MFSHNSCLALVLYDRGKLLGYIKFITEVTKVKHTNVTTIYNDNLNRKDLQKLYKYQAGRLGCRDLIKSGGKRI